MTDVAAPLDEHERTASTFSLADLFGGAAFVVLGVLVRAPWLRMPLARDVAVYATIGRNIGRGLVPYRDLFDHKQPLVYPVYWLIDAAAPHRAVGPRIAAGLVAGAAAAIAFVLVSRIAGRTRAAAAATLIVVAGASVTVEGADLNADHLLIPFTIAAVLVPLARSSTRRALASGFFAALAALTKATGGLAAATALIPLVASPAARDAPVAGARANGDARAPADHSARESTRRGRIVAFVAGAAAPVVACVAAFAATHALPDLYYANVTYNASYLRVSGKAPLSEWLVFPTSLRVLLVAALAVALARLIDARARDVTTWTLLAWLAGALVAARLSGSGYAHYLAPLVPPAAILVALPITRTRMRSRSPHVAWRVSSAAILAVVALAAGVPVARDFARSAGVAPPVLAERAYGKSPYFHNQNSVGRWLRAHAGPHDEMFVVASAPVFYWSADVRPASRWLYDPFEVEPSFRATIGAALAKDPPRFVVLPLGGWPRYLDELRALPYRVAARFPPTTVLELAESR